MPGPSAGGLSLLESAGAAGSGRPAGSGTASTFRALFYAASSSGMLQRDLVLAIEDLDLVQNSPADLPEICPCTDMRHSAVGDLADHPLELVHRFGQAVENRTGETVALQQLQLLSGIRFYSLGQPEKVTVTSLTMTGSGLTVTKPGFTGHEHR